MSESIAQFQQENERLTALCERFQAEFADLHDRCNYLSTLEQENGRLRCLLAQQSCSQLHSCEGSAKDVMMEK